MALTENSNELSITETPIALWLAGGAAMLLGGWVLVQEEGLAPGLIMLGFGALLALVLAQVTTIRADRAAGMLTITYRALVRRGLREVPLLEIEAAEVESSHSSRSSSRTYRVALAMKSGERIPLHGYYSSGYEAKERTARRINAFLGVERSLSEAGAFGSIRQALQASFTPAREGETNGIRWVVEMGRLGEAPMTRWSTAEASFPDGFLFLAQKPPGWKDGPGGGLLGALAGLLHRQLLSLYGFEEADLPGLEKARTLEPADPGLAACFSAFTTHPEEAQRRLNAWVANLLDEWARRFPLQAGSAGPAGAQDGQGSQVEPGQLVALFAPRGLTLALFNIEGEAQIEEFIRLGAALAREARA
jgi:hypothetical protein